MDRARLLIVWLALVQSGCSPDSSDTLGGGDRLPTRSADTLALVMEIPATAPNGSLNFGFAFDAAYLTDGSLAVADYTGGSVAFFDDAGRFLRRVGRKGAGPGEFTDLNWIEACGDDLLAMDFRNAKSIGRDGAILGEFDFPPHRLDVACSDDGTFGGLDVPMTNRPMSGSAEPLTSRAWIAGPEMTIVTELGQVPFGENRPLGKRARIAIDASYLYIGVPDSAAIDVFDRTGSKVRTLQLGAPLQPTSAEHYDSAIEELVVPGMSFGLADEWRGQLRAIPMPETLPPYSGLFIERDGVLWAVLSSPGDPSTRLRAIDSDGDLLANAVIPADLRVFDVGPEHVLGRIDDPVSGEQRIAVYRKRAL